MKMTKMRGAMLLAMTFATIAALASEPVEWTAKVVMTSGTGGHVQATAVPAAGYHFYAFPPDGGYTSLEFEVVPEPGVKILGAPTSSIPPEKHDFDGEVLASWDKPVTISVPFEITDGKSHKLELKILYQSCTDRLCNPPTKKSFNLTATYDATKATTPHKQADAPQEDTKPAVKVAEATTVAVVAADSLTTANTAATADTAVIAATAAQSLPDELTQGHPQWWEPTKSGDIEREGLLMTILLGFLGGLAALLTPCVWPMIPMTVSFFLKSAKGGTRFNKGALLYGLSIIIIYVVAGVVITLAFGAGKLNELSTSAVFNLIFFAILVVFAISFFGAFDIKLPARWSNAIDSKAESTTGLISIFFMAFTLVLVSFSCTGPIIGTLLVATAANGEILGPAIGMGGFALGLALPFTLFAIFPGMLKEMPKSGGWLNSVKVVLGFVELILALKFLSVADMAYGWRILDREVFLSLWIVLFVLLGLYLLGKLRFSHDTPKGHVGVGAFILSLLPLSFAVYLLPGLWGAPLKAASAFVPPLTTQDFNLYSHTKEFIEFDDYNRGMEYAQEHDMPVLLDFSGYGCVNCRQMEEAVVNTEEVHTFIADNFVVIKLMTDDKRKLDKPFAVSIDGETKEIETVGEKWMLLQNYKFGASTQPYYVVLDNSGAMLNTPMSYEDSVDKFMEFLNLGLEKYKEQ